jgi:hypothetical protein
LKKPKTLLQSLLYQDINGGPKELNIYSSTPGHRSKSYFRHQYFEAVDTACGELDRKFQQRGGMIAARTLEKLFLDAANEQKTVNDFPEETRQYFRDINLQHLQVKLQMLPDLIKSYCSAIYMALLNILNREHFHNVKGLICKLEKAFKGFAV